MLGSLNGLMPSPNHVASNNLPVELVLEVGGVHVGVAGHGGDGHEGDPLPAPSGH